MSGAFVLPSGAKVMAIGFDGNVAISSRFPQVIFWPTNLNRAADIPDDVKAIYICSRLLPGEERMNRIFAQEKGIEFITLAHNQIMLKEQLEYLFSRSKSDGPSNGHNGQAGDTEKKTTGPTPAPQPEDELDLTPLELDPKVGVAKQLLEKLGADLHAARPHIEAARIHALAMLRTTGLSISVEAIYQKLLLMRKANGSVSPRAKPERRDSGTTDSLRSNPRITRQHDEFSSRFLALLDDEQRRTSVITQLRADVLRLNEDYASQQTETQVLRANVSQLQKENAQIQALREEIVKLARENQVLKKDNQRLLDDTGTLREMQALLSRKR